MEIVDPNTDQNPIEQAISMEEVDVVDYILTAYSFFLERRDLNEATPLLLASAKKHCVMIERILRHNPDVTAIDKFGDTCLHKIQSSQGGVKTA